MNYSETFNSKKDQVNSLFTGKENFSKSNISKNLSFEKSDSKGIQALEDTLKSSNSKINTNRSGKCKIV